MPLDSALQDAAFDGDLSKVKKLVAGGARIESVNDAGETPLCSAALSGKVALVKFLLERGANPRHVSKSFKTNALHFAVQNDAPEIVDLLLARGANPKQKDIFGQTPLDVAIEHGHARVIVRLPGGTAPVRKPKPVKAGKPKRARKLPRPPPTAFPPLSSLETWRATKKSGRLALAESIVEWLGSDWKTAGALVGREGLAEVLHVPSSTRFVAVPSGAFFAGVREEEVELAQTLDWQEDSTLELLTANAKPATVAAFLCARAPVRGEPVSRKIATATLKRGPFRAMSPLEWEFVARDGGDSPFINGRTPKEAEAVSAALYGKRFDPKKATGALGIWGLQLGEWVSKSANKTLTGACGGVAQLYPWQGDELIDCLAGQRESVNSSSQNLLRYALSLPR
jgi:hypothetical protein